jgi:uncharacterized membrane protein YoaK (UPF0700 family)
VFTANMTGNIVFIGFALGGAEGFSIRRSASALAAFLIGAILAGLIANRTSFTAARRLAIGAGAEAALLGAAALLAFRHAELSPLTPAIIALTAVAMGIRNATVRKLGVADMTTTALTLAISGLAGDSLLAGGPRTNRARRSVSILLMVTGAVAGTVLVVRSGVAAALGVAALGAAGVAVIVGGRSESGAR